MPVRNARTLCTDIHVRNICRMLLRQAHVQSFRGFQCIGPTDTPRTRTCLLASLAATATKTGTPWLDSANYRKCSHTGDYLCVPTYLEEATCVWRKSECIRFRRPYYFCLYCSTVRQYWVQLKTRPPLLGMTATIMPIDTYPRKSGEKE